MRSLGAMCRTAARNVRLTLATLLPQPKRRWYDVEPVSEPTVATLNREPTRPQTREPTEPSLPVLSFEDFLRLKSIRMREDSLWLQEPQRFVMHEQFIPNSINPDSGRLFRMLGLSLEQKLAGLKSQGLSVLTSDEDALIQRMIEALKAGKAPGLGDDGNRRAIEIVAKVFDLRSLFAKTTDAPLNPGSSGDGHLVSIVR